MANDAVFIHALLREMRPELIGAKIDKIQQPAKDQVLFSLRTFNGTRKLIVSAAGGCSRFNFTGAEIENPAKPPMFCMLLRKHLLGARIREVAQPGFERIAVFSVSGTDDFGRTEENTVVLEMTGKSSNLIIVDGTGRIIDCLKRTDFGGTGDRALQPGLIYKYPTPQNKLNILAADDAEILSVIDSLPSDYPVDKFLLDSFAGISPLTCRELALAADGDRANLKAVMALFLQNVRAGNLTPYLVLQNDIPREFSYFRIRQYGSDYENEEFRSFSSLLDAFYSRKDASERRRLRAKELTGKVKTLRDRTERKLAQQKTELASCADRERIRKNAELVTANIYRIRKGDTFVECEDYYTEGSPLLRIELNPLKTPQQNSAAMFREYSKKKTAETYLTRLIEEGKDKLDYYNSVIDELERAENETDLLDIRKELIGQGVLHEKTGDRSLKVKARAPIKMQSSDGHEILVGRNNTQNDELTFRIAHKNDIWLHSKLIHGSHVIIRNEYNDVSEDTILEAAEIAAYYSQGRADSRVPVDYTRVKNVKRSSSGLPGSVFYTDYRTVIAAPRNMEK